MSKTHPWEVSDEWWGKVQPLIPVLAPWDIRSEKGPLRSERPRRKGEGMSSGKEHFVCSQIYSYKVYYLFHIL
jgi:hypothetical protein